MRTSKPKLVKCAGNCEKQLPHVDGHAIGWRPMCNDCYKDGKAWWYDELVWNGCALSERVPSVRTPNQAKYGRSIPGMN